ncbi:Ornithine carbamoyltransferase subunit F [Klebsiella pneumoniae]|nr:Ornithine carbamoyltransferase subunit F [Klebsiella pneumoniae]
MSAFYQKHFLKLLDFTPAEITALLELAAKLKADKKNGIEVQKLAGKNIALIFEKTQPVHDALSKLPHTIKAPA